MFRASYTVDSKGKSWVQTLREIDKPTPEAAIRYGRRLIKRMWPSARVTFRNIWVQHAEGGR